MERKPVEYSYKLPEVLHRLSRQGGLLLASTKASGESNTMTIGWGYVGFSWQKPIWVVMVRPSRYTYEFIEESGTFTVNVPTPDMKKWVGVCGVESGRDIDKFGDYGMTVSKGQHVDSVTIDACPIVYECQVVHYNDVIPAQLDGAIDAGSYADGDYHRYYYGEILATYAGE